jgi:hypothetical protein
MKRGMIAMSAVLTMSLYSADDTRIGEKWQASPQYQEYLKLQTADPEKAKVFKEQVITEMTEQGISKYIAGFDARFQDLMCKRVHELPIGLQGLLVDMHTKITAKLAKSYDVMSMSRIQTFEFNFVDSIYKDKGTALKSIEEVVKIAPELDKIEVIAYLKKLGSNYDKIAKNEDKIAKNEELNRELEIIIEKLKKL